MMSNFAQKTFLMVLLSIYSTSGAPADSDPIYDGCGITKKCLGFPGDNCVRDKDCVTFSSTFVKDGKIIFEMRSWKRAAYIAMGLSDDRQMGDDSVMECVNEGGTIKTYSSWTTVNSGNFGAFRDGVPQDIVRLVEGRVSDEKIYCQVERDAVTTIKGRTFDLNSDKFFMMLASGSSLRENSVNYHDFAYAVSKEKIDFKA